MRVRGHMTIQVVNRFHHNFITRRDGLMLFLYLGCVAVLVAYICMNVVNDSSAPIGLFKSPTEN